MGHVVQFIAPFQVEIAEYQERDLNPNEVRLATLYSGISSGTELSHYRGTNPGRGKTHDPEMQLFKPGASKPNTKPSVVSTNAARDADTTIVPTNRAARSIGNVRIAAG